MRKVTEFNRYGVVADGRLLTWPTLLREWRCGQCGKPLVQRNVDGQWVAYCHTCKAPAAYVIYYTEELITAEEEDNWHGALEAAGLAKGTAGKVSKPTENPGWWEALRGAGLLETKEDANANNGTN